MDIKIFIAAHKSAPMPAQECYVPIQVGASGKPPISFDSCGIENAKGFIQRDDEGDNISVKNPNYCELTGIYYIWKNVQADVVGLCHYRRYFSSGKKKKDDYDVFKDILNKKDIEALMESNDIILPKRNKYFIETLYSHYAHTHDVTHLDITREIIAKNTPEYLPYLDAIYQRTNGSMYNMLIVKKEYFDEYCEWVFKVLGVLEEQVGVEGLTDFQARLFGRVSELLLNVWILKKTQEGMRVAEVPVVYTAQVNWIKKGYWFLQAKFFGKKYTKSA